MDHLLCASRELPLTKEDSQYWSESQYYKVVKFLHDQGSLELISDNPKRYCSKGGIERFGLRGESEQYSVVTPGQRVVERYEFKDLLTDGYPGSILNIMGSSYMVKEINFDSKEIFLSDLPPHLKGSYTFPVLQSGISNIHCIFRLKPDTHSDLNRTVIPILSRHRFRNNSDTRSDFIRTLIPNLFGQFL